MTYRVLKSRIAGLADFDALVAAFAADKTQWAEHMAKVRSDPAFVAYPAPRAHPEVEASIREDGESFVPDFEVVDDGPSAEVVLREKKDRHIARIYGLEREAIAAVVPLGRRRHYQIIEQDIRAADAKHRTEILEKVGEVGIPPAELEERVVSLRTDADRVFLQEQSDRAARIDAIERHSARMQHDIEDLTEQTVDSWSELPFPR